MSPHLVHLIRHCRAAEELPFLIERWEGAMEAGDAESWFDLYLLLHETGRKVVDREGQQGLWEDLEFLKDLVLSRSVEIAHQKRLYHTGTAETRNATINTTRGAA